MIHWTRQIKEVLSAQETVETGENLGPLEEIEFWRNRCMDLSGISKQLVKPGVKHIESVLRFAKSSYLAPFLKLAQQIQVGRRLGGRRLGREGAEAFSHNLFHPAFLRHGRSGEQSTRSPGRETAG